MEEFEEREDPRYIEALEEAMKVRNSSETAQEEPETAETELAESYAEDTPEIIEEEDVLEQG